MANGRNERCACGRVWSGWGQNPSLECDVCYPPGFAAELNKFHPPVAGCETCERLGECVCWVDDPKWDRPSLGEIGNNHEPYCVFHGFNCDFSCYRP